MRRAQTLKGRHTRGQSLLPSSSVNDIGVVLEDDESTEARLLRQVHALERENDTLVQQNIQLQAQLAQRPPAEQTRKEFQQLELLLQGTQRENERAMAELEKAKEREKNLERELERLLGPSWQETLEMSPNATLPTSFASSAPRNPTPIKKGTINSNPPAPATAHIDQIRMLILGMDQRMQDREAELTKIIQRAESESHKLNAVVAESVYA